MEISVPTLLRIKPGALAKLGKYLSSAGFKILALCWADGMKAILGEQVARALDVGGLRVAVEREVRVNDVEAVVPDMLALPEKLDAIVAVGGGKAIDYCKYLGYLRQTPVVSVPTSIAHDGMASPTASLTAAGKRRSFKARIPYGVVMDTEVIARSPRKFSISGIGDIISKYTAIRDWKLAFHAKGEPVNDFAVLVSMQSVDNLAHHPSQNLDDAGFLQLVCGSLVMSGVAMEISGSSRPASGSEHLISHAYDALCSTPALHGIQVGVAAYAIGWLQENHHLATIRGVLESTGFLDYVRANPLSRKCFVEAVRQAPAVRPGRYTILSKEGEIDRLVRFVETDRFLAEMLV